MAARTATAQGSKMAGLQGCCWLILSNPVNRRPRACLHDRSDAERNHTAAENRERTDEMGGEAGGRAGTGADRGTARRRPCCGSGAAARRPSGRRGSRPPPAPSPPPPRSLLLPLPSLLLRNGRRGDASSSCSSLLAVSRREELTQDGPGKNHGGLPPVNKARDGDERGERRGRSPP